MSTNKKLPKLGMRDGSWVGRSPSGELREFFKKSNAQKALDAGWHVVTVSDHLAGLNAVARVKKNPTFGKRKTKTKTKIVDGIKYVYQPRTASRRGGWVEYRKVVNNQRFMSNIKRNPSLGERVESFIIRGKHKSGHFYYYTGRSFDSVEKKAAKFHSAKIADDVLRYVEDRLPKDIEYADVVQS